MKKAFFFGIAAVLALAVFSCDDFAAPQTEKTSNIVGYTADGRAILELELGAGTVNKARALHPTLAAAAADFYEVIFYDDNTQDWGTAPATGPNAGYYRTSWREGKTARIRVPAGDYGYVAPNPGSADPDEAYGNPSYAYIFAGRYDDGMLLGVGRLTSVDGAAVTVITASTNNADFTVNALTTDVNNTATSTFKVPGLPVATIKVNNVEGIPVFMIPRSSTAAATFGFHFSDDGLGTPVSDDLKAELQSRIIFDYANDASKKFTTKPYAWPDSVDDNPRDLDKTGLAFTGLPTAVNNPLPNPIGLTIATLADDKGKGGLCLLGIDIPVILATDVPDDNDIPAKTWHFKGGLNNSLIDLGYENMGMGGAVVIGSGNVLSGSGIIVGKEP